MKRYQKTLLWHWVQTIALAFLAIGCLLLVSSGGPDMLIAFGMFGLMCYHSAKRVMPSVVREAREEEERRESRLRALEIEIEQLELEEKRLEQEEAEETARQIDEAS